VVLLCTVYSQAQGCVCTALQLGVDVEQPWFMRKYDVIHKNGSTQHIITPLEEDRATAIGNMHKKFGEADEPVPCKPYVHRYPAQWRRHLKSGWAI